MKKFLALFLSFMLVLSSVPFAFAADEVTLSVETESTKAVAGDTIVFNVWLRGANNADSLCGIEMWLDVPAGLTVVSFEQVSAPAGWSAIVDPNTCGIAYAGATSYTGADMNLAKLTCTVDETASGTLTVSIYDNLIMDENYEELAHVTVSATITVHVHNFTNADGTDNYDWDAYDHWLVCSDPECGHTTESEAHAWEFIMRVEPNFCAEDGYELYTCTICGAPKKDIIPKAPHTDADHDGTCDLCCETVEVVHELTHVEATKATCTEDGNTEYWYCAGCGKYFSDAEAKTEIEKDSWIIKAAHELTHVAATKATCTEDGNTEYWYCGCGKYFSDAEAKTEIEKDSWIIKAAHTEETVTGYAATCTETGLTDGVKCSVCGEILTAQEVIPALGHDSEITVPGKDATCTEEGLTEGKKCSRCGVTVVEQEVIKALGHDWKVVKENEDEIHYECSACGEKKVETKDSNTEVDVAPDGSVVITTTNEDGTVTTESRKDGVTTTVTTDENGEIISVEVAISTRAAVEAAKSGEAVQLNVDAMVADEDLTITVNTNSEKAVAVEVPVLNVTPGCVIVIVNADGTETIVTATKMTEDGLVFDCPDGATIKVVDNSKSFADIKGENWYNDAIDFVSARGIMTGMTANTFAQNGVTTRAQLWTMLARLSGVDTTSTEGNWYDVARAWAIENGISDGTNADGELTREMLVTMLYRFIGETGESKSIEGFSDAANASDWAKAALEWAYGEGVMNGNADGTMNPAGETTRAQMAQFFMNFIQNI